MYCGAGGFFSRRQGKIGATKLRIAAIHNLHEGLDHRLDAGLLVYGDRLRRAGLLTEWQAALEQQ